MMMGRILVTKAVFHGDVHVPEPPSQHADGTAYRPRAQPAGSDDI